MVKVKGYFWRRDLTLLFAARNLRIPLLFLKKFHWCTCVESPQLFKTVEKDTMNVLGAEQNTNCD